MRENILNMNKFALVGKDISHSKSPEMYRKLISPSVEYDLLDYKDSDEIPTAKELLSKYDGINITSPYKKHFIQEVVSTKVAQQVGAINCLKRRGDLIIGENTDYFAVIDILEALIKKYQILEVVILGDGVMSKVAQVALENLGLTSLIVSRKLSESFDQLNLNEYFHINKQVPLIINTCAREYVFKGELPRNSIFWDFNYDFPLHLQYISPRVQHYFDGLDMLERQAIYAVSFWSKDLMATPLK